MRHFWRFSITLCSKKFQVIFWPLWSWMDVNFSIGIFKKRWQFPNDLNFVNQDLQSPHFSISFNLLPFWYKTKFFTKEFSSNLILFFPEIEWKSFETSESFHKVQFLWEEKIPKIATKKNMPLFSFKNLNFQGKGQHGVAWSMHTE